MKLVSAALLLLLINLGVFAQPDHDDSLSKLSQTTKIDEFSREIGNECDRTARLDALAIALQSDPAHRAQIIVYLGADQPFKFHTEKTFQHYKLLMQSYLVRNRDIKNERLNIINGGFRSKLSIELWLVPEKGETPKITDTVAKPVVPIDKTSLYADASLTYPYEDSEPRRFLLAFVKKKLEAEFGKDDEPKLSEKKAEDLELSWADADYGKIIKNQPGLKGVIIFYLDETRLDVKKVRKNIEKGRNRIAREAGISPELIKLVFGGYRDQVQADMWIVPKTVEEPKPVPERREVKLNENI